MVLQLSTTNCEMKMPLKIIFGNRKSKCVSKCNIFSKLKSWNVTDLWFHFVGLFNLILWTGTLFHNNKTVLPVFSLSNNKQEITMPKVQPCYPNGENKMPQNSCSNLNHEMKMPRLNFGLTYHEFKMIAKFLSINVGRTTSTIGCPRKNYL